MPGIRTYWNTLKYLKPIQFYGRILLRFYRSKVDNALAPRLRLLKGNNWKQPVQRRRSLIGPEHFSFLNRAYSLADYGWDNPAIEKLWRYNLHYFDDLNARDAKSRKKWHKALLTRWVRENPPAIGTGWEPYPTSLRIVNWIKWVLNGNALPSECLQSLAVQLRWLFKRMEFHLLGNHLLSNAKALLFGGLFFQGSEADKWFKTGIKVLQGQLSEQILSDGGHFERSPMYHLIILEDLLDLINICQAYNYPVFEEWIATAQKMLNCASVMRHPDGDVPFFNDAAFGISPTFEELLAYAKRLGINVSKAVSENVWLEETGYLRLENRDAVLFFDAAPVGPDYLPGHAHADTLSIELSLFGKRVLVNLGTSVYEVGSDRQFQRSTDAHNTLMVDSQNSSEVWGGFRVARRARVHNIICSLYDGVAVAEHDGYCHLHGKPVHRRHIHIMDDLIEVTDIVRGFGKHIIQGAWHLHPDIEIVSDGGIKEKGICLKVPVGNEMCDVAVIVQGPVELTIERCNWYPEFGSSVPTQRLVYRCYEMLPVSITTQFKWGSGISKW